MKAFTIAENDANQRVDKFISKAIPRLPQALLYKYLRTKRIKCNGKRCEISTRLVVGDVLELYINDEFFDGDIPSDYAFLRAGRLEGILYEDENLLLVDKQPGLVVHEDNDGTTDTLINRILRHLHENREYDPVKELSFTPSLCNRIDRNTGGIVIAAKNAEALRILNQKIRDRELQKLYLCVVQGRLSKHEDTMTAYLEKDSAENTVRVSNRKTATNRTIVTRYRVIDEALNSSLVEVDLITGRTHQIRAHFAYIGHPLLGDGKYGSNRVNKAAGYASQALYAYKLTFRFTTDGGALSYLNGRTFEVKDIWFVGKYFSDKEPQTPRF